MVNASNILEFQDLQRLKQEVGRGGDQPICNGGRNERAPPTNSENRVRRWDLGEGRQREGENGWFFLNRNWDEAKPMLLLLLFVFFFFSLFFFFCSFLYIKKKLLPCQLRARIQSAKTAIPRQIDILLSFGKWKRKNLIKIL